MRHHQVNLKEQYNSLFVFHRLFMRVTSLLVLYEVVVQTSKFLMALMRRKMLFRFFYISLQTQNLSAERKNKVM